MDFSKILFRASGNGNLMTDPQLKVQKDAGELSQTTKTYLMQMHRELRWKRSKELSNKYIEKGIKQEEAAITLLSRQLKKVLKKNDKRINNEFFTGEPDIFLGQSIMKVENGYDTKCSFDCFTFPYPDDKKNKDYYWQAQTYCDLTGAKDWTVSYCLVNTPLNIIIREQERCYYAMECPDESHPRFEEYLSRLIEIEKMHIFDHMEFLKENPNYDFYCKDWRFDIPLIERVHSVTYPHNKEDIERLKERVIRSREWLKKYHNTHYPSVLIASHDKEVGATIIE